MSRPSGSGAKRKRCWQDMWNWNWFLNVSEPGIPNNQTSNTIGFSGNGEPEHNKCLLGEKKHPDLFLVGTGFPGVGTLVVFGTLYRVTAKRMVKICELNIRWLDSQNWILTWSNHKMVNIRWS